MTAQPIKKKRFEGLIQFQDPLRQALVCLQAALGERFVTGAQLEFLKERDSEHASHFLLTRDGSGVGELTQGLESRHLLLRLEKLSELLPSWQPDADSRIAAWLDTFDTLAAQYIFQILAQAATPSTGFDLLQGQAWGSAQQTWRTLAPQLPIESAADRDRSEHLARFLETIRPLFKSIDRQALITDGCSVALHLEGPTKLNWTDLVGRAIGVVSQKDHHLLAIHYTSSPKPRLQCAYLLPMKIARKDLKALSLKGFLLLRDIV